MGLDADNPFAAPVAIRAAQTLPYVLHESAQPLSGHHRGGNVNRLTLDGGIPAPATTGLAFGRFGTFSHRCDSGYFVLIDLQITNPMT